MHIATVRHLLSLSLLALMLLSTAAHAQGSHRIEMGFLETWPPLDQLIPEKGFDESKLTYYARACFYIDHHRWKAYPSTEWENGSGLRDSEPFFAKPRYWLAPDDIDSPTIICSKGYPYKAWVFLGTQEITSDHDPLKYITANQPRIDADWNAPVKVPTVLLSQQYDRNIPKSPWRELDTYHFSTEELRDIADKRIAKDNVGKTYNDKANVTDFTIQHVYEFDKRYVCYAVRFNEKSGVCDNAGDPDTTLYWFSLDRQDNTCRFLGSEMNLFYSGDMNKDGFPELVFYILFHNDYGYRLVDDGFNNVISFLVNFH